MKTFEIQAPNGKIYEIEGDRMPSGAQLQAILKSLPASKPEDDLRAVESKFTVNPDPASPMSRFVGGVASSLNPVTMAKGIYQAVAHPLDTAGALLEAQVDTGAKAEEAERAGRGSEAAGYRLASGIPIVGPMIAGLGEQAGSGDIAGAAGSLTGALAAPGVYGKALQSGKAVAPAVMRSAGNAAQTVARGAGKAALAAGPEVVGAAAGNAVGGMVGGAVGAGIGNRILRPMVVKFLRERMGMSNVRAQEAAARMPESELVKIAQEAMPPQAVAPQGPIQPSQMTGSAPGGQAMVQAPPVPPVPVSSGLVPSTAIDTSRLNTLPGAVPPRPPSPVTSGMAPSAVEVRPIPPSKMPVRPPDPVVPELDGKPIAAAGPHPGYQGLIDRVKGKTPEEANAILADAEVVDRLRPGILERAGVKAVDEPTVRLYRVESKDLGDKGEWLSKHLTAEQFKTFRNERGRLFSDDVTKLDNYGWGLPEKNSFYVDVPKSVADSIKRRHPDGFDEFLVPENLVAGKKLIGSETAKPLQILATKRLTEQPETLDRISKAVSPEAAYDDLVRPTGRGGSQGWPKDLASEAVDIVWKQKDPTYQSRAQWMADRAEGWNKMRTASAPDPKAVEAKSKGRELLEALRDEITPEKQAAKRSRKLKKESK